MYVLYSCNPSLKTNHAIWRREYVPFGTPHILSSVQAKVSLIDTIHRLQSLINRSVLKVKRKGLNTDCKGTTRIIRINVCCQSLLVTDNHVLIQMVAKTETFDKAIIKVTL